jgi:hypothetical protein
MNPRKPHYTSLEALYSELDHESIIGDEDTDLLDDEDLALLHGPKPAPVKKPAKKTATKAPVKKKPKPKAKAKKARR